jgi:O-antigen/teichoic acid export membrane protein
MRRRAITAAATYGSVAAGVIGSLIAARELGPHDFGRLAIVIAAAGFFQVLLDLTVEEAMIKFGFRYSESGQWGKLRRLYRRALAFKGLGAVAAAVVLAGGAPLGNRIFGTHGLTVALLIAAALPLAQAPETLAGAAFVLRSRYDIRAAFLLVSMLLRLAGFAIGAHFGVAETVLGVLAAQTLASTLVGIAALRVFGGLPREEPVSLGADRREIVRFIVRSSIGTGVVSLRGTLAPLLLGTVTSPTQVGFFRAAQAPQAGFAALTSPARLILLTEQTRDWERGERGVVFAGLRRYTAGAALLMVAAVPVLYWLMPDLIRIAYGHRFSPASDAARILLIAGALQLVLAWTKSLPVSIGRPGLRILTHGIETVVLVPLVLVLGAAWDATGAAVATLAAAAVFAAVWGVVVVRLARQPRPAAPKAREAPVA